MANSGVADPMTDMRSMHVLLDVTEQAVLESMEKEQERKKFLDQLYAPEVAEAKKLNGDGYKPRPSGFDDDDVEASFDAFMAAAR